LFNDPHYLQRVSRAALCVTGSSLMLLIVLLLMLLLVVIDLRELAPELTPWDFVIIRWIMLTLMLLGAIVGLAGCWLWTTKHPGLSDGMRSIRLLTRWGIF